MARRLIALGFAFALVMTMSATALAAKPDSFDNNGNVTSMVADAGFNQFGYNYTARIFSGPASGWCLELAQAPDCLGAYSNDLLVMKWNAAWDACNAAGGNDVTACLGAWTTNEWNGMVPGGSGYTEHVKIIWVGAAGETSPYWVPGGYLIWNNYETIMDQGMSPDGHYWLANGIPNGLGG